MKHLRLFSESTNNGEDMDFDMFKNLFDDIKDEYPCSYKFNHINEEGGDLEYYQCELTIQHSDIFMDNHGMPDVTWEYLDPYIVHSEDPGDIGDINLDEFNNNVDYQIRLIEELKSELDNIAKPHKYIKAIIDEVVEVIYPRMKEYRNFGECQIGKDNHEFIISIEFLVKEK